MKLRLLAVVALGLSALSSASFALTPPYVWGPQTGVSALYDSAGHVIGPANPLPVTGATTPTAVAPSTASSVAESCHVYKASAGTVYSVSGYTGAAAWIMLFNATAAPADGAVTPIAWAYAPAAGSWSINYGVNPASFSAGVTACNSSTGPLTKTAVSTNVVFAGQVQ